MTITKKIQNAFPGITVLVAGVRRAFHAFKVYNRGVRAMEALKLNPPVNKWARSVSIHSVLSYYDACRIYYYLSKQPGVPGVTSNDIRDAVIDMANAGRTADAILGVLKRIKDRDMMENGMYITVKEV